MQYSATDLKNIQNCGMLSYAPEKIINLFEFEPLEFIKDFNDTQSEVYNAYRKGADMYDFIIDKALFDKAKEGDTKALEKLEMRKLLRK